MPIYFVSLWGKSLVFVKNLTFLFALLVLLISYGAKAQSITGTIEDPATGEKLFGAAVLEKGTSNGAITDFDGKFTLKIQKGYPAILVFSYVGYKSQEY